MTVSSTYTPQIYDIYITAFRYLIRTGLVAIYHKL